MKTKKKVLSQIARCLFVSLLAIGVLSCETDIPLEDREPPQFSFQITGDGFNHTFNQDTDFNAITLMLRRGVAYDFIFTGSDEGGMERMAWIATHQGRMSIASAVTAPWVLRNIEGQYSSVEWSGNRNDPLTGSIAAGSFRTQGTGSGVTFRFSISDFGGERGTPNRIWKDLRVYVGAHNTRIRN